MKIFDLKLQGNKTMNRIWKLSSPPAYHPGALAMLALIATGLGALGCRQPETPTARVPEHMPAVAGEIVFPAAEQRGAITTTVLSLQAEADQLQFPGKIVLPDNESWHVGVLSTGRIERIYANLGDFVHKGQVLARMHSHDVHEAKATYAMGVAEKSRLQAAASLAQINFDRMQRLFALRAASVEQVEQSRQELVNAKTALENGQIDVVRSKAHLEENLGIPADLPADANPATAELIPIIAPASGYVLQKSATPGTTVGPATDIFVLGNTSHLWMLASVGQEQVSRLKVGQLASITLPGIPGEHFSGRITNLGQEFDPTTRRLQVRIDLDRAKEILRPEMLATAEISVGETHPLVLVAPDAIQQVNGQDVVFVRKAADRFVMRPVRVGDTINGKVPLLDGVHSGEEVVTQGSFLLKSQLLRTSMQGE